MKKSVFDLCLVFHLSLIRVSPSDITINDAESILVAGDDELNDANAKRRYKARNLAASIQSRFESLSAFGISGWQDKIKIYVADHKRAPGSAVFRALRQHLDSGDTVTACARSNGINNTCVFDLKKRVGNYQNFADKLAQIS